MDLFLLRHGNAESVASRDSERQLSAAGHSELHAVLSQCQTALSHVEHVLVSPYVRAQQTWDVARQYLPHVVDEQQQTVSFLTPNGSPQAVIDWAYGSTCQSVLLVTHQPLVGTLLGELCGFEPGLHRMTTASLAMVKMDLVARGLGELCWLKQP